MMRNQSGYPDPTAEEAIGHVIAEEHREARRPMVYICAPYRGNIERNIRKARKYSRFAVEQRKTPIATHLLFPQILGKEETAENRKIAGLMAKQIIRRCRELWWFGDVPTEEMMEEIRYADRAGVIVRHFSGNCEEVVA